LIRLVWFRAEPLLFRLRDFCGTFMTFNAY
jgi:hypothetical protein